MAKIHGRAPLPLPDSLQVALDSLGYRRVNPDGWETPVYRHADFPALFLEVAASNIPGDSAVIARWAGQPATRLRVDLLIAKLTLQLNLMKDPNQPMPGYREDTP